MLTKYYYISTFIVSLTISFSGYSAGNVNDNDTRTNLLKNFSYKESILSQTPNNPLKDHLTTVEEDNYKKIGAVYPTSSIHTGINTRQGLFSSRKYIPIEHRRYAPEEHLPTMENAMDKTLNPIS